MKLCLITDCSREAKSRGLCFNHYTAHRTAGTLDTVALPTKHAVKHILSNIDTETQLGTCSVCGENTRVHKHSKVEASWRCGVRRKQIDRSNWNLAPAKPSPMVYRFGDGEKIPRAEAKAARARFYVEQDSRCAICKRTEAEAGSTLHLDHCHNTGALRGLLCNLCNTGLGMFKDSAENLKAASEYLTR